MKPKPKAKPIMDEASVSESTFKKSDPLSKQTRAKGRWGLAEYTKDPDKFPTTRVIYSNKDFVVINDSESTHSASSWCLPFERARFRDIY